MSRSFQRAYGEMWEYLKRFPDATAEEIAAVRQWVKDGNSPYENGDGVYDEAGYEMDYITPNDIKSLDRYEGIAAGCYRKETIPVDDFKPGYKALVYLSNRSLTPRRERSGYMERIIKAAIDHQFTKPYIQMLRTFCADRANQ